MHKKLLKDLYRKRNSKKSSKSIGALLIISLSLFAITQFVNIDNNVESTVEISDITDFEIILNTTTTTLPTTTSIPLTTTSTTTTIPIVIKNIEDAQNQLFNLGLYTGEIDVIITLLP